MRLWARTSTVDQRSRAHLRRPPDDEPEDVRGHSDEEMLVSVQRASAQAWIDERDDDRRLRGRLRVAQPRDEFPNEQDFQ